MTRYRISVEYCGTGLVGWQRQANGLSVQQALEEAIHAFCGASPTVYGAGRTDAGVHALEQVAHFDLPGAPSPETVRDALNFHLRPAAISVVEAAEVDGSFDARRSATGRRYLYRIFNRRAPPALLRGRVWHVAKPLDAAAMHEAAQVLIGRHDFSSFRASLCQAKTPVKTLARLSVMRKDEEIHIEVAARSFLHNQVRIVAGTLKLVGEGKWTAANLSAALAAKDRSAAGPTAPAEGLYLSEVLYEVSALDGTGHTGDEQAERQIEQDDGCRRRTADLQRGPGDEPLVGDDPEGRHQAEKAGDPLR